MPSNQPSSNEQNPLYNFSACMEDIYRARAKESSNRRFLSLSYYDKNPPHTEIYRYLNQDQKNAEIADLLRGLALYYNQFRLDVMEGRQDAVAFGKQKINTYTTALSLFNNPRPFSEIASEPLDRDYSYARTLNKPITTANALRFNYLWTSSIIQSGLDTNKNASWFKTFKDFSLFPGAASFLFYFFRGGSLLTNRVKHIVPSSYWMTSEELALCEKIGFWERLLAQMNIDKYLMLNDLVWGPANFDCFVWYSSFYVYYFLGWVIKVGSKAKEMAQFGNILTIALFGMDLLSSLCQIIEAQREYSRHKAVLDAELEVLKDSNAGVCLLNKKQQEMDDNEFEFQYNQKSLLISFGYALCLVVGFAITVGVLSNPFGATLAAITGAAMCWCGNFIKDGLNNQLSLDRASEELWLIWRQDTLLCAEWDENNNTDNNNVIFRKHLRLSQQFYQKKAQQLVAKNKLWFMLALDVTLPAVLWLAMFSLPWTQGVVVVAATLLIAYAAYQYLIVYAERCTDECALSTDLTKATNDPNFVGYVRTTDKLYFIDRQKTIKDLSNTVSLNDFDQYTQSSLWETTKQFFYALITLAPIFGNIDNLMDELVKFSSDRHLTNAQVKFFEVEFSPHANDEVSVDKPTALTKPADPSKGGYFFGQKTWEKAADKEKKKLPGPLSKQ
jgi:hypothetical protein